MNYIRKQLVLKFAVLVIVGLLFTYLIQRGFDIKIETLEQLVQKTGILAPISYSIMLILGLTVPFNPISDYLLVNVAAIVFPVYTSILATFAAHSIAISINYFVARKFGWKILNIITNTSEQQNLKKLSEKITTNKIFFMRWLLPLTAIGIDIVSYAAAIARIQFIKFYIFSIIPWTILNIIFFTSTTYVVKKIFVLFFIPGLLLVLIPFGIYSLYKYTQKNK